MRTPKSLHVLAMTLLPLAAPAAHASPENGWWWNPTESGRGFSLEIQGDTMFLAGYFYDSDGQPTWLSSAGAMSNANDYSGRLASYRGGQTLMGDYRVPDAALDAGGVMLHFDDDTHATLTWPGGDVAIERFRFGGETSSAVPETGWWWNPDESGRGTFFEFQGDMMFAASFLYDEAGRAVWFATSGPMASGSSYAGSIDQYANGQTLDGGYQPPTSVNGGTIAATFSSPDEATVALSDDDVSGGIAARAGIAKGAKVITLQRYRYGTTTPPEI